MRALIFHETTGFRYPSIPYAIQQLRLWGRAAGVRMTANRTSAAFTDRGLARYDVVIWLSTAGGVREDAPLLTDAEWAAFQRYMQRGGGYAGIHAGSDCCHESRLVRRVARQPGTVRQRSRRDRRVTRLHRSASAGSNVLANTGACFQAVVQTEDSNHPSTRHLPDRWPIWDELHNFKANPRSTVHVLQTLDESSYNLQPHPFIRGWGT